MEKDTLDPSKVQDTSKMVQRQNMEKMVGQCVKNALL